MRSICCFLRCKEDLKTFKVYLCAVSSCLSQMWGMWCFVWYRIVCVPVFACQIYDASPAIRDLWFWAAVLFWEVPKDRALIMASCLSFDVCGPMTKTTWQSLKRRPQKGDNSQTDYVLPCMRVIWDDHNSKLQGWNVGGIRLVSNRGYSEGLTSRSDWFWDG